MPDSTPTLTGPSSAAAEPTALPERDGRNGGPGGDPPVKRKIKKLRLFLVLLGLGFLALISTVFGMMMAVASEIPSLENSAEFKAARNSSLVADDGSPLARLTGNQNRILIDPEDISPNIKNAVIAIEDKRFYTHKGVDWKGMIRAGFADFTHHGAVQGGSTITEQFVKNALAAQNNRTIFEKLREAALAYHLEKQWSKQKILGEYLNTVYFGNGAYGIESAMRTYFGGAQTDYDPNERAARNATPDQAALLAGIIASPSAFNPVTNRRAALARRNLVLKLMLDQRMISMGQYQQATIQALPSAETVHPPRPDSKQPYFSTWVTQQLVDRLGSGRVFGGGLKIKTTIDPDLQAAAEQAINGRLAGIGPSASLVAIDNKTGEVRAMVGGDNYDEHPFNIATDGHRQPGSAFKPFTLVEALIHGISAGSVWPSAPVTFKVSKRESFPVHNFEDSYLGSVSLANALAYSDNSVFARVGIQVGVKRIARLANKMGLHTPVSHNLAITLGALKEGVNPLEMAYAYSTIANDGKRITSNLPAWKNGPVAVEDVNTASGHHLVKYKRKTIQVIPANIAEEAKQVMNGVVTHGTGTAAQLPDEFVAGKTGTTENYGDAWFVGFDSHYTVAVWVGYPDKLVPMKTQYRGGPVEGGTYPAEIWHDFMVQALNILAERNPKKDQTVPQTGTSTPVTPAPSTTAPSNGGGGTTTPTQTPKTKQQPTQTPQQQTPQQQTPPAQQTPTPGTGGGTGGASPSG
ncbi:MAG TPA: transglycosylase domain-containing protein [Thermoleophilaceae bacterium]|jgi:penicillin-binding protein 1A